MEVSTWSMILFTFFEIFNSKWFGARHFTRYLLHVQQNNIDENKGYDMTGWRNL